MRTLFAVLLAATLSMSAMAGAQAQQLMRVCDSSHCWLVIPARGYGPGPAPQQRYMVQQQRQFVVPQPRYYAQRYAAPDPMPRIVGEIIGLAIQCIAGGCQH